MKPSLKILLSLLLLNFVQSGSAQSVAEVSASSDSILLTIPYFEIDTDEGRKAYSVQLQSPLNLSDPSFSVDFSSLAETALLDSAMPAGCEPAQGEATEIARAFLYIEHNATDEDTGVHGAFDDHGWSILCVWDPDGNLILNIDPKNQFNNLTLAAIFFESREPPNDEYSIEDLKADFPAGQYTVRGKNFDGTTVQGEAMFTHDIPVEPNILSPTLAEDEEDIGNAILATDSIVVNWEPVVETLDGDPANITAYEVIVTKEDHDDPNGYSRPVYDVHVPGNVTSLSVPEEFFEAGEVYELEVLAIELSGNQTISVGFFETED